jgi:hypothetical protein
MRCMQLDNQDKAALRALDADFTVDANGEAAKITGEMQVIIIRPADNDGAQLLLTIVFPGGELFDVRLGRAQLLQQLGIEGAS